MDDSSDNSMIRGRPVQPVARRVVAAGTVAPPEAHAGPACNRLHEGGHGVGSTQETAPTGGDNDPPEMEPWTEEDLDAVFGPLTVSAPRGAAGDDMVRHATDTSGPVADDHPSSPASPTTDPAQPVAPIPPDARPTDTAEDFMREMVRGARRFDNAMLRLRRVSREDPRCGRRLIEDLAHSRDARHFALDRIDERKRPGSCEAFEADVRQSGFDLHARSGAPITVKAVPKPNGTCRFVFDPGIGHYGRAAVVAEFIRHNTASRNLNQRNRWEAIDDIAFVAEQGQTLCVAGDVQNCHLSLDARRLYDLTGVPATMIRAHVMAPPMHDPAVTWQCSGAQRRLGREAIYGKGFLPLMAGGPAAPAAAAVILSAWLSDTPGRRSVMLYGDDFVLLDLATSIDEMLEIVRETAAPRVHGQIRFKHLGAVEIRDGIDILGMRLTEHGGRVSIRPSMQGALNIAAKITVHLEHEDPPGRVARYLRDWSDQTRFWDGAPAFTHDILLRVRRAGLGRRALSLDEHIWPAVQAALNAVSNDRYVQSQWRREKQAFHAEFGRLPTPWELDQIRENAWRMAA